MRQSIIALVGKKQSGKDTAADFLVNKHGFVKVPFAGPLKEVCRVVFGLTNAELHDPVVKEASLRRWPYQSPRNIMQLVGTECFRNQWPDVWIEAWKREVARHQRVVVTDCRFLNEAAAVRMAGGWVLRVKRERVDNVKDAHLSEQELEQIICDRVIFNNTTIEDFHKLVGITTADWF